GRSPPRARPDPAGPARPARGPRGRVEPLRRGALRPTGGRAAYGGLVRGRAPGGGVRRSPRGWGCPTGHAALPALRPLRPGPAGSRVPGGLPRRARVLAGRPGGEGRGGFLSRPRVGGFSQERGRDGSRHFCPSPNNKFGPTVDGARGCSASLKLNSTFGPTGIRLTAAPVAGQDGRHGGGERPPPVGTAPPQ